MPNLNIDKEDTRLYYSIGEVAEMLGVNTSLVRFWEKEFDVLKPKKNKKGNRLFTGEDLENIRLIYHLVKERGYTLDGAKKKLRDNKLDLGYEQQLRESLSKLRGFLQSLHDQIQPSGFVTHPEGERFVNHEAHQSHNNR